MSKGKRKKLKGVLQTNRVLPPEKPLQNRFLRHCGKALLLSASYQVFSLCMNPGQVPPEASGRGYGLFSTIPAEISSLVKAFPTALQSTDPAGRMYACIVAHDVRLCPGCNVLTGSQRGGGPPQAPPRAYDPVADQHNQARNLSEQGVGYYNNKDWAMAVQYFRAALEKWPENETIRNYLKNAEEALQREQEALQNKVLRKNLKDAFGAEASRVNLKRDMENREARKNLKAGFEKQARMGKYDTAALTTTQLKEIAKRLRTIEVPPPVSTDQISVRLRPRQDERTDPYGNGGGCGRNGCEVIADCRKDLGFLAAGAARYRQDTHRYGGRRGGIPGQAKRCLRTSIAVA